MDQRDNRPTPCSTALTLVGAALLALGVVMVFSAGASLTGGPLTDQPTRHPSVRQAAFSAIALLVMLLVGMYPYRALRIRPRSWYQPTVILVVVALALLAVVLVPGIGQMRHGARRWLSLGPAAIVVGFQPSEIAKLAVIVFLAAYCAWRGDGIRRFWLGLLPPILIVAGIVGLVAVEDFGTGVLLAVVATSVLVASRARWWHLAGLAVPGIFGMAHFVTSRAYRMERLLTFLNPYDDPQGSGYHQIQSLITIASGRWWGRGLGAGIQKYGYLPESRSDFIFAVICEEMGIVGGAAVIALFIVLLWQGRRAMLAAPNRLGSLLALGATLMIGVQAAMNIAVVTVSVPTKGIALPFVSAGGTGVIIYGVILGIIVNVGRYRPAEDATPSTASRLASSRGTGDNSATPTWAPTA